MIVRQFYNELYRLFARKRTYIGFVAFLFLQLILIVLFQLPKAQRSFERRYSGFNVIFEDYFGGLSLAVIVIAVSAALLGSLYLALIGGDIVAKEIEEGTMRMILARPISRMRLLLIKWLACVAYTMILIIFLGCSALIITTAYRGYLGKLIVTGPQMDFRFQVFTTSEGLWRYLLAIGCLSLTIQAITSMSFMWSCFRMKPAAAMIITLSFFFADMIMSRIPYFDEYKHIFITYHMRQWMAVFDRDIPWSSFLMSMGYLVFLNGAFWTVGTTRFYMRDLKT